MSRTDELTGEVQRGSQPATYAGTDRRKFWADTCREVTQMQIGSNEVRELYRTFGCRFCAPTLEQVQSVLNALDSAMPAWERSFPRLFYETLELNFPELVRHA